jgi:hypothetical protein
MNIYYNWNCEYSNKNIPVLTTKWHSSETFHLNDDVTCLHSELTDSSECVWQQFFFRLCRGNSCTLQSVTVFQLFFLCGNALYLSSSRTSKYGNHMWCTTFSSSWICNVHWTPSNLSYPRPL